MIFSVMFYFIAILLGLGIVFILFAVDIKNSKRIPVPFLATSVALSLSITIIFLYSISNDFSIYSGEGKLDMAVTGQAGDFLGGIVGTIIGGVSTILFYKTFTEQLKFNLRQKEDMAIERFENKFYQMLSIHRDNVDQIDIKGTSGRKSFSRMFNELKFIYYYCKNNSEGVSSKLNSKLSDEKIFNISYLIFFFGIGQTSNRIIEDLLDNDGKKVFIYLSACIQKTQSFYRQNISLKTLKTKVSENEDMKFYYDYVPFQGHMGNLSHYIRHIYQLIKYVDEHYPSSEDINKTIRDKKNYITTVRSQLSNYEQAFIYYNALSVLGKPWLESDNGNEGLLKKYQLIKSLPKPLADFYKSPDEIFKEQTDDAEGDVFFEWTAIKDRFQKIK